MSEMLIRKRVRVTVGDGRTQTLPGKWRVRVDKEAGTVELINNQSEVAHTLAGASFAGEGKTITATAGDTRWDIGCGCGG